MAYRPVSQQSNRSPGRSGHSGSVIRKQLITVMNYLESRLWRNTTMCTPCAMRRGSVRLDLLQRGLLADVTAGADGITAYSSEDRRHIRDSDIAALKAGLASANRMRRDGGDAGKANVLRNVPTYPSALKAHRVHDGRL